MIGLLLAACCPIGPEVYRPATVVNVQGDFSGRVVACSWSHWSPPQCENRATAAPGAEIPEWNSGGPFVVFIGEAPLMQTIFVACDGATPVGARFHSWSATPGPNTDVPLGTPTRAILGEEGYGVTDEAFDTWMREICAG